MATQYVGRDRTAGVVVGYDSSSVVGFYGDAGAVRQTVTAIGTTTISQVATSGKWAFASSTAALAFVARVQSLQDKLATIGLIAEG